MTRPGTVSSHRRRFISTLETPSSVEHEFLAIPLDVAGRPQLLASAISLNPSGTIRAQTTWNGAARGLSAYSTRVSKIVGRERLLASAVPTSDSPRGPLEIPPQSVTTAPEAA